MLDHTRNGSSNSPGTPGPRQRAVSAARPPWSWAKKLSGSGRFHLVRHAVQHAVLRPFGPGFLSRFSFSFSPSFSTP